MDETVEIFSQPLPDLASLTPEQQEQYKVQLVDFLEMSEREPLRLMTPSGAQHEWAKMCGGHRDGLPRLKFFSGANKVLKTSGSIANLANLIWGPFNEWWDFGLYKEWPYPTTVWIDSEDSTLKEILIPEMYKWFPTDKYKIDKGGKTFEYHWICQGKNNKVWNIYIKTYDTSAIKLESALLGLVIFSEPPPQDHYYAIPARMPEDGMIWMEFTPLVDSAWVFDDLMSDVEMEGNVLPYVEKGLGKKIEVLYADIESACKQHGVRGRWEHSNIEKFVSEYKSEEKEARAHGKFAHLKGRVYKDYDEKFVIEPHTLHPLAQIWMLIDPHERRPPLVQWWAVNPEGPYRFELIAEHPHYSPDEGFETLTDCKETISEMSARWLKFEEEQLQRFVKRRIMDPNYGKQPYATTRKSVRETYSACGIKCSYPVRTYIDVGHDCVKHHIRLKDFRIWDNCQNTNRAFKNYKHVRNKSKEGTTLDIRVEEKWKDPMDLVRYFFMADPKYQWGARSAIRKGWRDRIARRRSKTSVNWRAC